MHLHLLNWIFIIFQLWERIHTYNVQTHCSDRFEYRHEIKRAVPQWNNCTYVFMMKPFCQREITVAYSEQAPYVVLNRTSNAVIGYLPGMLRMIYETCCHKCTKIRFRGPFTTTQTHFENASIIMPIESSTQSKRFLGYDYVDFVEVKGVSFLGKEKKGAGDEMANHLFKSILQTWPLFLIAFMSAIIAGCVVWVLDMWFNKEEFPSSFPRGPFEGFWWAFVSMTTVGYGDRAPKSIIARLFAVIWILFGITVFSMYTATLTSALTMNIQSFQTDDVYGKKVAVLNTSAAGISAVMQKNSRHKEFGNVDDMITSLVSDQVEGIALDDKVVGYYIEDIRKNIPKVTVHEHININDNSYGVITEDENITKLFRTFFENNEDNRLTMVSYIKNHHWPGRIKDKKTESTSVFSVNSPIFLDTVIALLVSGVITVLLGLGIKWFFRQHSGVLQKCVSCQEPTSLKEEKDIELTAMMPSEKLSSMEEEFFQELDEFKMKWMKKFQAKRSSTETT